mmetsp:Transcript_14517/g.46528  ORF Transcript_14517/g.46528 Transcript_14517/m.46528 type:complete len:266 (-) Transcript_14517:875-1672(-)
MLELPCRRQRRRPSCQTYVVRRHMHVVVPLRDAGRHGRREAAATTHASVRRRRPRHHRLHPSSEERRPLQRPQRRRRREGRQRPRRRWHADSQGRPEHCAKRGRWLQNARLRRGKPRKLHLRQSNRRRRQRRLQRHCHPSRWRDEARHCGEAWHLLHRGVSVEGGAEKRIDEADALARIEHAIPVRVKLRVELIHLMLVGRAQALLLKHRADEVPDLAVVPVQEASGVAVARDVGLQRLPHQVSTLYSRYDSCAVRSVRCRDLCQ